MGGLQLKTNYLIDEIDVNELELLILPGGEAWERGAIQK